MNNNLKNILILSYACVILIFTGCGSPYDTDVLKTTEIETSHTTETVTTTGTDAPVYTEIPVDTETPVSEPEEIVISENTSSETDSETTSSEPEDSSQVTENDLGGIYDGEWISIEKNTGIITSPILKFEVKNSQVISLDVSVFPLPMEYFWWFISDPLEIEEDSFRCSTSSLPASSGQGEFTLEATFTSESRCEGVMTFPKGFFWIDFTLEHDVTFTFVALLQQA